MLECLLLIKLFRNSLRACWKIWSAFVDVLSLVPESICRILLKINVSSSRSSSADETTRSSESVNSVILRQFHECSFEEDLVLSADSGSSATRRLRRFFEKVRVSGWSREEEDDVNESFGPIGFPLVDFARFAKVFGENAFLGGLNREINVACGCFIGVRPAPVRSSAEPCGSSCSSVSSKSGDKRSDSLSPRLFFFGATFFSSQFLKTPIFPFPCCCNCWPEEDSAVKCSRFGRVSRREARWWPGIWRGGLGRTCWDISSCTSTPFSLNTSMAFSVKTSMPLSCAWKNPPQWV